MGWVYNTVGTELNCRSESVSERRHATVPFSFPPGGRTFPSGLFQNPLDEEFPEEELDGNPMLPDHMLVWFNDTPAGKSMMNLPRLLASHMLCATASVVQTYVSSYMVTVVS